MVCCLAINGTLVHKDELIWIIGSNMCSKFSSFLHTVFKRNTRQLFIVYQGLEKHITIDCIPSSWYIHLWSVSSILSTLILTPHMSITAPYTIPQGRDLGDYSELQTSARCNCGQSTMPLVGVVYYTPRYHSHKAFYGADISSGEKGWHPQSDWSMRWFLILCMYSHQYTWRFLQLTRLYWGEWWSSELLQG